MKKRISALCVLLLVFLSMHASAFADIIIEPFPPRPVQTTEPTATSKPISFVSPLPVEPLQPENVSIMPYLLIGLALIVLTIVIWRRRTRLKK